MSRRNYWLAFAAGAALVATGCSDQDQPAAPTAQPAAAVRAAPQGPEANPNALARGVPGFGGFFYDAAGAPVIYLKDPAERRSAEMALSPYLLKQGIPPGRLQVRPGRFSWIELESWQARISLQTLPLPGAVFVDADEAGNQVRVGVERGKGAQVRAAVVRMGLPASAVSVEETEPVTFALAARATAPSLQGRVRPLKGGIQVNFPGFLCTLGFSANEGAVRSFITNSHCTAVQGGTNATLYWQPLQSEEPVKIATEAEDPTYRAIPGCPGTRVCRRSDASRAKYNVAAGQVAFGKIAKTQSPVRTALTITGNFTITNEGEAVAGQTVSKVGRTTGWSRGRVTAVCANTNLSGTNITQLCQDFVTASVGPGDSGSPVFAVTGGTNVTLLGILWGGSGSNHYVFSPLSNVEAEIGALTTH